MLDLRFVRENPEIVKQNIRNKFQDAKLPLVDEVIALDVENRGVQQETQPQNETDGEVKFRANMLAAQANKLQQRGLDVKAAYENNPEFQRRVLSGEWDFYDVAEAMTTRRVPQPVRQPNGAGFGGSLDITSMTDEQFAKLNARLAKGDQFR